MYVVLVVNGNGIEIGSITLFPHACTTDTFITCYRLSRVGRTQTLEDHVFM